MPIENMLPVWPYWHDTHLDLVDRLEILDETQWTESNCHQTTGPIRSITLRMLNHEQTWIQHIAQGKNIEPIQSRGLNASDIISEIKATRAATQRWLSGLAPESLRTVRTAPGNPATNEIERNVTLAWIIWHVMEFELISWGQIQLRLSE